MLLNSIGTKKLFFISIIMSSIFGIINIFINKSKVDNSTNTNIVIIIFTVIFIAIFLYLMYCIILSIVLYFVAAAMGKGFDIKTFIKISARSLIFLPLTTLFSDTFGFIFIGVPFIKIGLLGLISYIPFYVITIYNIYRNCINNEELSLTKRQSVMCSLFGLITLILISFPY